MLSLAQQADLKDQQKRDGVKLNGAHFPRAREGHADAANSVSRPTRVQTDPLAPPGRGCGCWPTRPFVLEKCGILFAANGW